MNFKLHVARVRVCVSLAALAGVRCGIGGQPVLEVGVVCCANIDQRLFLIKPYIGCFFLLGQPCSHASFQRLCYAIGVFFGCSLRLLILEKWRFSNRSTPDNAQFVRRAPVGYFRIQKGKGNEEYQKYMEDLTDMQNHVLPYLQSFCSLEEKGVKERREQQVVEKNESREVVPRAGVEVNTAVEYAGKAERSFKDMERSEYK